MDRQLEDFRGVVTEDVEKIQSICDLMKMADGSKELKGYELHCLGSLISSVCDFILDEVESHVEVINQFFTAKEAEECCK